MNNVKIHLVPQPVIDCAENLKNNNHEHLRLNYIMRLEAIRDYCDQVLKKDQMQKSSNMWNPNNYKKKSR